MRVPLSPSAGWQRIAGGIASAATREDMMTALAGLEAVLVKATVDGVDRTSSFRSVGSLHFRKVVSHTEKHCEYQAMHST